MIDELLGRFTKLRLPPLAVGMGMYLPMSLTLLIPIGALLGRWYDKWAERQGDNVEFKKRLGVLMATGLIVGESMFGVVFAGIVAASGSDAPLAIVGDSFENWVDRHRRGAVRGHGARAVPVDPASGLALTPIRRCGRRGRR